MTLIDLGALSNGETFAVARRRAGLRQEEIARVSGLSRGYVSQFELGRVDPPERTREAFWEALSWLQRAAGGGGEEEGRDVA